MQQSKQEAQNYQEDEIDLRALFNSLFEKKFLIAGLTGFVTVLAILYVLNLAPTYKSSSSFTSPSEMSITTINKLQLTVETKDSIFSKFLKKLSSKELQKIAFVEGGFLTLFNPDNSPIDDVDGFISGAIQSVKVNSPSITKNVQDLGFLTELPYSVAMEGESAEAISEYLNSLIALVNSKTIADIIKLSELKISNRLDEISLERDLLIEQAEKDRFSKIERIKEEDGQKIRQINDQIGRARYKAKETRLDQIEILTQAAKLAKSLGVIENNLNIFKDINAVNIAIGESNNLPDWYLYGENALIKRVQLLENRISDDPFIPELVTLNNQLNEVQNNNLLITLETRQDDSPFIAEIAELEVEKIKLESKIVSMNGVNAMQLSKTSLSSPIELNKRMIVLLAFFGSFMMSVFLVLIMGALKPDEKAPTA
ncbi:Wzz/FepE/Etk N-terminal domain-containing protein [Candidatus Thioglobus sp.]|nr:Wzz/FepE/Etk N-terminal domain-containing protein [Candidatus Thioglobus sp.]